MSDDKDRKEQQQLKIKIDDSVVPGYYANQIVVMHSRDEFILDYVAAFPPEPNVVSRLIMTPGHFKRIVLALNENLKKYESQFGEITVAGDPLPNQDKSDSIH